MPRRKGRESPNSLRTLTTTRLREKKVRGYPYWDSSYSPVGQVEFGTASQKHSAVYQYGQARAEAGLSYVNPMDQNDSQGWEHYFGAELSPKKCHIKRESPSPTPASKGTFKPAAKPALQSSNSSTTISDHPARRMSAASKWNSGTAASTRTTPIRRDKRKAHAMADALEEILAEAPCKKHSRISDPRTYDAEHDVLMCSCTDRTHIID